FFFCFLFILLMHSCFFICIFIFFFFKQKTAYEITRRDWSSDVCSSDLRSELMPDTTPSTRCASKKVTALGARNCRRTTRPSKRDLGLPSTGTNRFSGETRCWIKKR